MTPNTIDELMTRAAKDAARYFTPAPALTPAVNAIRRLHAMQEAQVKALEDAGVTPGDLDAYDKARRTPTTRTHRTDADREEWRATREAGARRRADRLARKLTRLEAQKPAALDRAATGGDPHRTIIRQIERENARLARLAAETESVKIELDYARERVNHWKNWEPAA